jgi:MtN3 and saliva related transmembrane protein
MGTRMSEWWVTALGTVAGLCTTGSFVPQVVKVWREGDTRAISRRMYVVLTAGFVLWLGYGLTLGSWPIVAFNAANLVLSAVILRLKLREGRNDHTIGAVGGTAGQRH